MQVQFQNFKFSREFHFKFHSNVEILDYITTSVLVLEYLIQIMIQFFFSCVQKDKCQTDKLGIRNSNLAGALDGLLDGLLVSQAENASCPVIDMVCCNDLDVITPDTRNLCSLHSDIFYRYITNPYPYQPIFSWLF